MGDKENISVNKRYPERNRTKIKYEEFEMSMEKKPKHKKAAKEVIEESEEEVDSEDDTNTLKEEENNEVSEYEKLRLKNLEENRRIMMELGLIDPLKEEKKKTLAAVRPKPLVKKRQVKKNVNNEPTKRSLRLQRKTPEGRELPLDLFQDSPSESPSGKEEKLRIEEEFLPMNDDGECTDFLDSLKSSLSQTSTASSVESVDLLIQNMRNLEFTTLQKVNSARIQSMCIHPIENKLLVLSGNKNGELALWNATDGEIAHFTPHLRAINCVSVDPADHSKLYTTSFDGTVRRADVNKSAFEMVYQTNEKVRMCHITWHSHVDSNSFLVAHGTGEAGLVDTRTSSVERWFHCHPRSIRTIHLHPTQPHYFLTASGTGECKIWDLRGSKKHTDEFVGEFAIPKGGKGITSGFFSPDGTKVVTTCNDDFLRIYDVSDLTKPTELTKVIHDNHTGRWLSVFKAIWHTHSPDLIFIGSMLHPRRIQMFSSSGRLVKEIQDENITTVLPVIALHPTLPILVGGNSSGKGHVFTIPEISSRYVKFENVDSE